MADLRIANSICGGDDRAICTIVKRQEALRREFLYGEYEKKAGV